jgi:hypothetical protein
MGFVDSVAGVLFSARLNSDYEYQLQIISQRKMALMSAANQIGIALTNSIFEKANPNYVPNPSLLNAITGSLSMLGQNGSAIASQVAKNSGNPNLLQGLLLMIHAIENELDARQKSIETNYKIRKEMQDNFQKIAKENAKKSFTIG